MGLLVAFAFLAGVEGVLRLLYGSPQNARFLRPHWIADGPMFSVQGDLATTTYQGFDSIGAFPRQPTPGVPRLIGFGESSMRGGSGLPPASEFPGLIASMLSAQGTPLEAVNLGRSGFDSDLLPRLVHEALAFQPTLALFYFGHNDIANATIEQRYGDLGGALEARATVLLERTQLFTQLQRRLAPRAPRRPLTMEQIVGMTGPQLAATVSNFQRNLSAAVELCRDAGVQPILITPGSPIDRWFASNPVCPQVLPDGAWTPFRAGYQLRLDRISQSDVERAHQEAPDCPEVEYLWGLLTLQRGDRAQGWALLAAARDDDPVPMRASSQIVEAVREVARAHDAGLVDFEASLRELDSENGLFIDNVHLAPQTHQMLAKLALPVVRESLDRARRAKE